MNNDNPGHFCGPFGPMKQEQGFMGGSYLLRGHTVWLGIGIFQSGAIFVPCCQTFPSFWLKKPQDEMIHLRHYNQKSTSWLVVTYPNTPQAIFSKLKGDIRLSVAICGSLTKQYESKNNTNECIYIKKCFPTKMRPLLAESVEDHLCTWSLQLSCSRVLTYSVAMQLFS